MTARRHIPPFCAAAVGGHGGEFDELLQFGPTQATRASVRNEERSATWSYGDGGLLEGGLNRGSFVNGGHTQASHPSLANKGGAWTELAGNRSTEATRVAAPATQDLAQSQVPPRTPAVEPAVAAPQLGWGDREETSTQLWAGLPHQRFSLKTSERMPRPPQVSTATSAPAATRATSVPSAHPRPGRLPVEARPRLPSPSVAPGRASATNAGAGQQAPLAGPPPRAGHTSQSSQPNQTQQMVPVLGLMNEPRPLPQQNAPAPTALPTGLPTAPSSSRAPAPPTVRTMLMAPVARAQPEARSAASVSPVPAAPTGSGEPAWDSLPPSAAPQPVHAPAGRTQPMPPMTARVSMVAPKPWTAVPTTTPSPRSESESALESAVTSVSAAQAAAALVATPQPRPMPPKPPARKSEPPAVVALRNAEPDPREAALEQLQNQLVETMERARAQESRAHDAEERAARAEAQLSATASGPHPDVEELRVKLVTATERFHQSELQLVEAERRAQSSEELVRLAKQRLADASAQADEDTVVQKQKSFGLGAVLGGVGLCLLTTGLGGYYGAVSPLQKQVAAQQQQHQLESEQQARALVTLQSQRDGERRSLETEAQELRSKLQAALTESLNATETADASRGGRPARAARRVAAEPTEAADSNTRSARAIAHRYRRARAEAQADGESTGGDEAENSRPARASRAEAHSSEDSSARTPRAAQHANDDNDPLGGL